MSGWRKALVVGLGVSGNAAAELLLELGCEVWGYDRNPAVSGTPAGLRLELGDDAPSKAAWQGIDLLVLSPGVPPEPFLALQQRFAPTADVQGELGLAFTVLQSRWKGRCKTVLVTGTNGKSTVTALTAALLRADGKSVFAGGNLGDPLAKRVVSLIRGEAELPEILVLECSSFQLETLPDLPREVAMLLNLSPDHLDRYRDFEHYAATKARVFRGLGRDGLALIPAGLAASHLPQNLAARVGRVGDHDGPKLDSAGDLEIAPGEVYPRSVLGLVGRHNAENALFALAAARHLGARQEACLAELARFTPLPHRMNFVEEIDGVQYFDDSKATNVASVIASLQGFPRPFVLIAGGRRKGEDLRPIAELLRQSGIGLVAIGESAEEFLQLAEPLVPAVSAPDMLRAVAEASRLARKGAAVVLAPACASYDQFRSYAHRGEVFQAAVRSLKPGASTGGNLL